MSDSIELDENWPRLGMSIWDYPDETPAWSRFSGDERGRQSVMDYGFLHAAIALVDRCERQPENSIPLVYPILYCLRHGVELGLKSIIDWYAEDAGVKPKAKTHDILALWKDARLVIEKIAGEGDSEATAAVECLIQELHEIDPGSFAFRYATHKDGKPIELPARTHIHLPNIKRIAMAFDGYFLGVDGELDHQTSSW